MKLRINIADLTNVPPLVGEFLIKQEDIIQLGTYCRGKNITECWYVIKGDDTKLSAIRDILKGQGVRVKELKE